MKHGGGTFNKEASLVYSNLDSGERTRLSSIGEIGSTVKTRRSVEHCTPHADGAWLNELGWSQ